MTENSPDNLVLEDGSNIAVIGGGPSGSFFTYFALDFADRMGLDIKIDIIEAKDFNCAGAPGCNHCGGIVSESLIQLLSTEGIVLPANVIRRGIESYTLHMEQGSTVIETPFQEQRIAAMFRGLGPRGAIDNELLSFDNYLLDLCRLKGANVILDKVSEIIRTEDGIIIRTKKDFEKKYDFVVGAVGLNKRTFQLFNDICPSFITPETTKTHICEFYMDKKLIDEYFGNSMHVFLLNLDNIKFGALIPKGHYVTMVLLGSNIDKDVVAGFLNAQAVKECFPPEMDINKAMPCQCYPSINVKGAKEAYADRVVLIGDSSTSKLYKNGIGAAYITAKAAANTAIFHGISGNDFKKYFQPTCKTLAADNAIGKFIFAVTTIIQKSSILKGAMLQMVINEQKNDSKNKRMSSILWDTFTGSAPYKDVFRRFMNPILLVKLIGNIAKQIFKKSNYKKNEKETEKQ